MPKVKHVKKDDVLLLVVDEERLVDDLALQEVQRELLELLGQSDGRVVLDLSRVGFVSSAALGLLVRIRKQCGEAGTALKLCGISPAIDETFRICGLNALFQIYPNPDEALASFSK
jgi:anti-sigma B factor antagonist